MAAGAKMGQYLPDDCREDRDLAAERPDKVAELAAKMLEACDGDYGNGHIGSHFRGYEDERATAYPSRSGKRGEPKKARSSDAAASPARTGA